MSRPRSSLRICLIASSRFPVREPFAGGLEAHTHALAKELRSRGHHVTLFARAGSDPDLDVHELPLAVYTPDDTARKDVAAPPEVWMEEHHAYLGLMLDLMHAGRARYDLVHNNSLHHLPVAMSRALDLPVVTTLHTPPLPWLTSAAEFAGPNCHFVAVSKATARAWANVVPSIAVPNGVDLDHWRPGPGGGPAIWSGRIVPEKAPHLAIAAARRAEVPLRLVGEVLDRTYYEREVAPLLAEDVEYLGHVTHGELAELVGGASVALVTPAWDEPFGLVAAEAMACGTPVAAFSRGALPELVTAGTGAMADPGDVQGLAEAVRAALALDRREVRREAEERLSHRAMVDGYEGVYSRALEASAA